MATVRPNDRCPCGSGKNYKKCCAKKPRRAAPYASTDRESALAKLDHVRNELEMERTWRELGDLFWRDVPIDADEEPGLVAMSDFAFDCWCFGVGERLEPLERGGLEEQHQAVRLAVVTHDRDATVWNAEGR
jgi:hypothetical protein